MYDRDTIELALWRWRRQSQGRPPRTRASPTTVGNWERGRLPHARSERAHRPRGLQRAAGRPPRCEGEPLTGGRAAYEAAMTENMLLRAVLDDLKGQARTRLRCRTEKVRAGREIARGDREAPPREITAFLRISRSPDWYWRAALARQSTPPCAGGGWSCSRRAATRLPHDMGAPALPRGRASEKVVRRLMREEGTEVVYSRRRRRGWFSTRGGLGAPPNLVAGDFGGGPDELGRF